MNLSKKYTQTLKLFQGEFASPPLGYQQPAPETIIPVTLM